MVTPASKFLGIKSVFASFVMGGIVVGIMLPLASLAQTTPTPKPEEPRPTNPNTLSSGVFSLSGAERLMSEAMAAVSKQNYDLAVTKLQDARQIYNQLSNFYQDLTGSFTGLDNRIADSHRQKALQSAQLSDQATYQLALVYRGKNLPELAVPLLVQLIRSQQPTRELGQKAYQQLYELGFVDDIFPRASTAVSTPPKTN